MIRRCDQGREFGGSDEDWMEDLEEMISRQALKEADLGTEYTGEENFFSDIEEEKTKDPEMRKQRQHTSREGEKRSASYQSSQSSQSSQSRPRRSRNFAAIDEPDSSLEDGKANEEEKESHARMRDRFEEHRVQMEEADEEQGEAILFDEALDGEENPGKRRTGKDRGSRQKKQYDKEYDDRSPKEGTSHMSRKERKDQREYEEFLEYKHQKKKKKRHRIRKVLLALLILVLLIYALGTILLRVSGIQESISSTAISSSINEGVGSNAAMKGYTNIALFGVDARDDNLGEGNRTDVMIIASINNLTGDIKLVSLYRDTYLDIGDGDYQKANAAYAYGGAEQAVTMINTNLDLNVSDYVTVGFAGITDIIDSVGGIEITVTEEEISYLNDYQSTMAEQLGVDYTPVTTAGTQTLNGLQATAFCRIRYTDGGDFTRTERQKEVLTQTFSKLKSAGPLAIINAAVTLSGEIQTSLSASEIVLLAMKVFMYDITDTNGFPNEDLRTTGYIGDASCVIPITLESNVTWLHEYLFDDTGYEVSDTVSSISSYISSVSGYY